MADDFCQCPACGRMHKSLGAGNPPKAVSRPRDRVRQLSERISLRLNNHLCEMEEGYDDSIVGFNKAWDIVRAVFDEELGRP
ncbi:MAG: hypothetical protein KGL39_44980 [Patescibacteria group bacterium]|nr:hypothetical protein [Patescibacteria group bacterium]